MAFETLLYEARDGIAWVTLNRPRVLNALNLRMRDELWALLDAVELDVDLGVVIFRGAGERAFSSGADISEFGSAPSLVASRRARLERDLWGRLLHFSKPTIAAVHGYTLGAGCELALLCDFRIAAEDALLGLPEAALGYVPTAGGTQTLPRTIGPGRALHMLATGEPIDATTALDFGLVQWQAPRTELYRRAEDVARRLLAQPRDALLLARRALRLGADLPLEEALRHEAHLRRSLRR
ncbi:MAG TPA: enoyl-CoA hydratase/isomerase family protein [Dehalococcoidia bacterium]|nr:enoyl-CoA hydratase/isomerase family protein [Dehalococcoidia bacterium]